MSDQATLDYIASKVQELLSEVDDLLETAARIKNRMDESLFEEDLKRRDEPFQNRG